MTLVGRTVLTDDVSRATEPHYTVAEVAEMWNYSRQTVQEIFRNEPGVLVRSIRETDSIPPYEPMSPAELADLEREAGRSLTEEEAQQFRIRKLKKQLIDNMLDQAARTGGAK